MRARIIDNDWVMLDQVTLGIEPALVDHFSVKHPRAYFIDTSQQGWDGYYRKYDVKRQRIARPLLRELEELCKVRDFPLAVEDQRSPTTLPDSNIVDANFLPNITLEQYQIDAIKRTCDEEVGIFKCPTGSGKTELAAGITKLFNCLTVIIAEQRVVIEQIKERLLLRDLFDVGLFYGGEMPNGQKVVVGSIQSLATPPASYKEKNPAAYAKRLEHAKQFQAIVKKADLLLVDEVDKASSANYRYLFKNWFRGRRKYGFSATPFDAKKPVENLILKEHIGSVIYEVDRQIVQDLGRIVPIQYNMIAIGEDGDKGDKTTFDIAEREQMIDNPLFHLKIKKIVDAFPNDGTLILVDTGNVEDLGNALEAIIPGSVFIYGKTSKSKRNNALRAFERREIKCLIGGKILKRGLDLKGGVNNLILCGGGQLWSNLEQSVGRSLRVNEKGFARVFGFLFLNNHYLYKHGREQLKAIVEMGYESRVIFKDQKVDGASLVRARFRKPKLKK